MYKPKIIIMYKMNPLKYILMYKMNLLKYKLYKMNPLKDRYVS